MTTEEQNPEERHPTAREWSRQVADLRAHLLATRPRAFPPGRTHTCPECGARALEARDDLVRETMAGTVAMVHHNLHGAVCTACGAEFLESYESLVVEESAGPMQVSDYLARVTNVSGRNLGTYWPKDVVRVMDLHPHDALRVHVLDADTMLIQRSHDHA